VISLTFVRLTHFAFCTPGFLQVEGVTRKGISYVITRQAGVNESLLTGEGMNNYYGIDFYFISGPLM
jgi:hypothetical protein